MVISLTLHVAAVSAQQTPTASVESDGKGGFIVTNADGTKVALPASTLAQAQGAQVQSGSSAPSSVSVTGPVTPLDVIVTPGNVSINQVNAVGTTQIVVPVTTIEKKRVNNYVKVPGKCKWILKGTKLISVPVTENKEYTGKVNVDLTPAVQEAVSTSRTYTDTQVAALVAEINRQRQTATIAVPVSVPTPTVIPQQTQTQSQTQTAVEKKKSKCPFWTCKVPIAAGVTFGVVCATGFKGVCRGGGGDNTYVTGGSSSGITLGSAVASAARGRGRR